jgi:hypothetical protein
MLWNGCFPEPVRKVGGVSLRKTSSNGNTRFRTDEIYETLIELVEVSGLPKAFLAQQAGESVDNIDTTIKKTFSLTYAAMRTCL